MAKEPLDGIRKAGPARGKDVLHGQLDWLRVTLACIGDAVITTDSEGRITFLNPVAESLTGWHLDDALGEPLEAVFSIINQDTRLTVESPSVRALRDGVVVGLANHTLLVRRDGTECPIDDSAAPIRNDRNEVAGVVLVFRDISERHKQERLIQDTLSFVHNIIATLREPFLVINGDLKVHTANRAFYEHFRTSPEETDGRMVYDLGNGQWDIPPLRALLSDILTGGQAVTNYEVDYEFPIIGRRSMLLNALKMREPGNQSSLILLAIQDVTKEQVAAVALADSENRYRRLFEAAKDGILILDFTNQRITDANPFICDLLGYSLDQLIGKELWEIGLFANKSESEAAGKELRTKGYIRYDHLPLESALGHAVDVEVVANVYAEDHHVVIQFNIRDITERVVMERKLAEQTLALADLHRRKDEFLAMLSHELRNPLAPIANAVHLLRLEKSESAMQRRAHTMIERQVTQLTRLVDDLLEVSRIATGRVLLRLDRVAVNAIVERAVDSTRSLIEERNHQLTVLLPPEPIWLFADAARLEQVFVNLLTNAAKYTDKGGTLGVTVEEVGHECVVAVRDTGCGIAPEILPKVFELFTQAERSLDRSQGGLGIGLALVQRLVEMHDGRVGAVSVLGVGSEFVVNLPLLVASPEIPLVVSAAARPPGASLRILIVDDNVDSTTSFAALLGAFGHDTRTAFDGLSAVEVALDYLPHVMLLDIGLPKLNGYEVAKRLRQQPTMANLLLVALSGYGTEADRMRAMEAGFDHHLAKPADFDKLQDILADAGVGQKT